MSVGTHQRRPAALAAIAALVLGLGMAVSAFGVDRTEVDWDAVAGGTADGFDIATFKTDHNYYTEEDQFTGGSKDVLDIQGGWYWRAVGQVPDKTDLLAAAIAYDAEKETIYFATDRYATNGDAKIGFWFLQDRVAPNPGGTFSGAHENGDVLVEATFTQGGPVRDVKVWQWVDGALKLKGSGQTCAAATDSDIACGTVNSIDRTDLPEWEYAGKFSTGTIRPGGFFNGAIDLAKVYGDAVPCFGTAVTESRAAGSSVTSELKDLIIQPFRTCADITIQKVREGGSSGDTFEFTQGGDFDADTFELTGAASVGTIGAGNRATFDELLPGTYEVTETDLPEGYTLAQIDCGEDADVAPIDDDMGVAITVESGDSVTCTFLNGYRPEVNVIKDLYPSWDPGRFNLLIDGTEYATAVGDGGETGFQTPEEPSSVEVSETPADGTDLADYTTTITCDNGEHSSGTSITFSLDYGDRVTCTIHNSLTPTPTRTQGYWQTHWALTTAVWNGEKGTMSAEDRTLCGVEVTATDGTELNEALGGFWSGISSDADAVKRSRLDQARMSLVQQLVAALINRAYFGARPAMSDIIDDAKDALCATGPDAVRTVNEAQGHMGWYNSSGDALPMPEGDKAAADPTGAQERANIRFWDAFLAGL